MKPRSLSWLFMYADEPEQGGAMMSRRMPHVRTVQGFYTNPKQNKTWIQFIVPLTELDKSGGIGGGGGRKQTKQNKVFVWSIAFASTIGLADHDFFELVHENP